MSAGVDYDLLADYVGGALEGTPEQERIARLVATSSEWSRAADEFTSALYLVQNDLNILRQTPEPMPEDVAARFESLFEGPRLDPLEPRVVRHRSARSSQARARRWKRWAAPVAIAAAVLGFFAFANVPALVVPALNDGSGNRNSVELSDAAPGAAPQATVPVPILMSWRMYDRSNLGTALANGLPAEDSTDRKTFRSSAGTTKTELPAAATPLERLTDPHALRQCLDAVNAVLPGRVNLVEYAYFEGSAALVISITSSTGEVRFVAGANCGPLGPDERYRTPPK